ncbi:MAG: hypothetical protein A2Z95_08680 [Gallionellales bacterium GWA2_60_18]|nr:MAG: hypothetical protein A2Z95_08680 [Gallionellales bacterium GWA2_60_18]
MSNSASFDLATLAAVKPALDGALAGVGTHLEQYLAAPAAAELETARDELHRLTGVLKMARLDGVAAVCAELENVLRDIGAHPDMMTVLHRDVLRHALTGIVQYLDALSRGADNAALRLFPQYQELQHLRGLEMAFELDLFFPELDVELPANILNISQQGDAVARIKAARAQYQQGLMRWLRQEDMPAALQAMQRATRTVLICIAPGSGRAFWWVASGLLDCMAMEGLPPELNARRLLGRIDQQMRAAAEGNPGDTAPAMNEMLYLIGRSHTVSALVEEVKRVYALDHYLPELSALQPGEVTQLLDAMRDRLHSAEECWEQAVRDDAEAGKLFAEHIESLAAQAERLDPNTLQYLTGQIQESSRHAADAEHARAIATEMAMALLLLDSGIVHYGNLGSAFQEQARILAERLQAAVRGEPEDAQQLAGLVELYCRTEQGDTMAPLASEMLANLQIVEQGLNAFFGDAAKRGELAALLRWLDQIRGGLRMLSLEQAEQLLVFVRDSVRHFAQGSELPKPLESRALANAVGTLENYLQHLLHGQAGDVTLLLAALADVSGLHRPPEQAAPAGPVATPSGMLRPMSEDQELLEVFLEEAQEVLDIMRDNLEICQLHPDSREPLVTIRRGFHTLKGSGRMVGLTELGGVAWGVERALNKWLQDNKPASPGLLRFIHRAAQAFAGWVEALAKQGHTGIEADELVAAAQRIENGEEPEQAPPAQPVPEVSPLPEEEAAVTIGDLTLSPMLFNIASAEARQNLAVLQRHLAALREMEHPTVSYDFMRAAHTLAGVNRTMGFAAVVELAVALESWLEAHREHPSALEEAQLALLEQAIAALDAMTQAVCAKQMPQAQPDLAQQLAAAREQAAEAPPPVAEAEPVAAVPQPGQPAQAAPFPQTTAPPAAAEKPQARDELDEQLLPVFLEEADDLFPKIGAGLRSWREQPQDETRAQALKRLLHTLKGSSRMAGAMRIGELAHGMETRVLSAAHKNPTAEFWEMLESGLDEIGARLEDLRSGEFGEQPAAEEEAHAHGQAAEAAPPPAPVPAPQPAAPAETEHETTPAAAPLEYHDEHHDERRTGRRAPDAGAERALSGNMLRVRSDVIDRLVNEAGEISVARSRIETEMRAFKEGLLELTGSVARLRAQLREVEIQAESQIQARISLTRDSAEQFDPLEFDRFTRLQELTRFMNESVHDVQTVQLSLLKNIDETAAAMSAQARLNRELQQGLMSVRMVPFASVSDRLYRIVRQTARELDKRANLELSGITVELDRSVLEKMTAPFEHLLRNAIAHGLEDEETRKQAGKNPIGEVRLHLRHEGNEVVFEFGDDGAGLNFEMLREKALAKGLLQPGEEASDDQLAQLIFVSGMSTAAKVTEVAGRGIGMDVVRSEIAGLGGRIDVDSARGRGTQFIIHLPLTLAVTQALMLRAGDATYAVPSTMVEQVRQTKPAELEQFYRDQRVEWQGKTYPFHYLPHLLGDSGRMPESLPRNPILLLRSGEQRIALHVDELLGNQETVVKNIGPQLARLTGIAGATVLGNGRVVLILNPAQLAQRIGVTAHRAERQPAPEIVHTQPLVMVVDDSLTVRKVTSRLLQRAGYLVVTAKDGVDALEQLGEITPSVMLLDIEMPRMDGFELTKHLRRDPATRDLPIIMITSRSATKHRDHALSLGVNAYLGKPFQEEELLRQIAGFVSAR